MMSALDASPAPERPAWLSELSALKERLEEIMRRPKATARDAEEAVEAAKALTDLLRGEERALRLLGSETTSAITADTAAGGEAKKPYVLAGLPLHEAAERVLEDSGWPMHVSELGDMIKVRGWRHPRSTNAKPDQIRYQLAARLPRHPEVFKKFAPNTFGLAKWGDSPPRTERPKPRLGLFPRDPSYKGPSAQWLSEHPEAWYGDMVKDDRG